MSLTPPSDAVPGSRARAGIARIATPQRLCYHRAGFDGPRTTVRASITHFLPARGRIATTGRVSVASSAFLTSGAAGRYATALFEIARDDGKLDKVEEDVTALEAALADSDDLTAMIHSPIPSRAEQGAAMAAIAAKMGLGPEVSNTVALMAANRRLFVLPAMLAGVRALTAEHRGEVTAEVTAPAPLDDRQTKALAEKLRASIGKEVKLAVAVDRSLIAGLIVKVGSRMIDTSIRSKLSHLQNELKEVG